MTSTRGGFAIPQISPVREVIKWLDQYPEEGSRDPPTAASPSLFPRPYEDPYTPQRRQPRLLPEARGAPILSLYRSLGETSSGAFLALETPATHQQLSCVINSPTIEHLPPLELPDWSLLNAPMPNPTSPERLVTRIIDLNDSLKLAKKQTDLQKDIVKGQTAQLILQAMSLRKMNHSLNIKKSKKQSDRTILFQGGRGRHMTSDETIQLKRKLEEDKKEKESKKKRRKEDRDRVRNEKADIGARWKVMLAAHKVEVGNWEVECEACKGAGLPKRQWPKKPKRPLKPKPTDDAAVESEDDEDEMDEDE
ncbi:hypothetical protein BDN71DRAFT_1391121 [Pleurotus eryngii]|uniref:Uncharacterized protein n=1 Tax=Pleurotus eryngii TaxID=5323 RepID=A0A9P5ZYS6_PLEER|nr:hypothetical protein BDN71DRAFT_1391121 [Pleurotus eryngii]